MTRPGELLIVGFEGKMAPPELLERIAAGRIGGVVLFARNLGEPDEIAALLRTLDAATPASDPPLVLSLDQEGGRVQRVKAPLTVWPPMARLGARDDAALATQLGHALGREIGALGFNVDYAPVLDVQTNPANPVIGDRAFGTSPVEVTRTALAFWLGLEAAGVRGCAKHFPGHGDTAQDSHLELPQVDKLLADLEACELLPFAAAARQGVPLFMTAHVVYPQVDPLPATLSARWLTDIARRALGFRGVMLSDDLDMKAVAGRWPVEETVTRSLAAGADSWLACQDPVVQQKAEAALEAAVGDAALRRRLDESIQRMRSFRATLRRPSTAFSWRDLPLAEHATLAQKLHP